MDESDDIVWGTIAGIKLTRHRTPIGPIANLDGFVVRLADGNEVDAVLDLRPLKHSFMFRCYQLGSRVRLRLGSVLEPIRIVEIFDPA